MESNWFFPRPWAKQGCAGNGKKIYKQQCAKCHTIEKDEGHHADGPNLNELIGRKAGSVPGYEFSTANKELGEGCGNKTKWTCKNFFDYIKNPRHYVPGTKKCFKGIKSAQDRMDLLEYLKTKTGKIWAIEENATDSKSEKTTNDTK